MNGTKLALASRKEVPAQNVAMEVALRALAKVYKW